MISLTKLLTNHEKSIEYVCNTVCKNCFGSEYCLDKDKAIARCRHANEIYQAHLAGIVAAQDEMKEE